MQSDPLRAAPKDIPEFATHVESDARFEVESWFHWRRADLKQRINSLMIEFLPEHASVRTADAVAVQLIEAIDHLYECERRKLG